MDTTTIIWIVVGVLVVLAIVALIAMMNSKKKKEEQRAESERVRQNAAAEQAQLREREQHAQAAAAEADQRREEADRAAAEARKAEERAGNVQQEASALRQNVDEQHRKADLLDPDVDTDKDGFRKDGSRPGGLDDDGDRGVHRADHVDDNDGLRHDNRTDDVQDAAAGGSYGLHQQGEPRHDVMNDDFDDDVRDPAQSHRIGDAAGQRRQRGIDQQGQHEVDFGDGLAGNSPHGHDGTHDNRDGVGSGADQDGVAGDRGAHHDGLAYDHRGGSHGAAAAGAGAVGLGAGAAAAAHHRDGEQGGTLAEGSHEREQLRDRVSDEDRERYGLGQGDSGQGTMADVRGDQHHGGYDQQGSDQADFGDGLAGHSPASGQPGAHHETGLAGGSWNDGAGDRAHGDTTAAGREVDYEDGLAGPGGRHDADAPASVYEQTRQDHQGAHVGHDEQDGFADESTAGWATSGEGDRVGDTGREVGRQSWGDTGNDRPATADDYLGAPAGGQHEGDHRAAGQLPPDGGDHLGQGEPREGLGAQGVGQDVDRPGQGEHDSHKSIGDRIRSLRDDLRGRDQH